jgi:uncharacterized cupredoxin-like copper-binding protein
MTKYGLLLLVALIAVFASKPAIGQLERATVAADTAHVEATLNEWSVSLSVDTVAAGAVHFMIRNAGSVAHSFEIEREGNDDAEGETEDTEWKTGPIEAGAEATLSADLVAGTYEIYCPQKDDGGDHEDKGMTTKLIVR